MNEQTQTKVKQGLEPKDLKALKLIQQQNPNLTAIMVKPESSVIGLVPNDPETFGRYKEDARKILDKQSEHLDNQGIEFLVFALIEEVWGEDNHGKSNQPKKDDDDE